MTKPMITLPFAVVAEWLQEWEESQGNYTSKYVGRASEKLAYALVKADERLLAIRENAADE